MIDPHKIYKIKDSIDVYLEDDEYIVCYFVNTRIRKRFKIGTAVVDLFSLIDGENTPEDIYLQIVKKYPEIERGFCFDVLNKLLNGRIICERLSEHVLDDYYLSRYDRQINYFAEFLGSEKAAEEAQQKLINTRIGIIGCGSVGGNIAIQLAMAGVENFVLMDFKSCDLSDASRHLFYSRQEIGNKKVESLSRCLKKINSRIKTFISYSGFNPKTDLTDFVSKVDFIVNAADEPYLGFTANLLSQICVPKRIPHYIAGGFDAHLASTGELVIPYVTPCAACYSTFFEAKLKNWIPEKHPVDERVGEMGGLSSMTLFSSSFACIEIIKFICGLTDIEKSYKKRGEFYFDGMELMYLDPERDPNCKVCGGKRK